MLKIEMGRHSVEWALMAGGSIASRVVSEWFTIRWWLSGCAGSYVECELACFGRVRADPDVCGAWHEGSPNMAVRVVACGYDKEAGRM